MSSNIMSTSKNKVYLFIVGLLIIAVALTWNIFFKSTEVEGENQIIKLPTSRAHYKNFDDLVEKSDLIVLAQSVKDFNEQEHHVEYADAEKKLIKEIYTLSEVKINKILKDKGLDQFEVGQTIKVVEPASKVNTKLVVLDDYNPIQKNGRYVLFLKKNDFGNYSILNMNGGKYNLDNTDAKDKGEGESAQAKQEFKKDLLIKFDKELSK